MFPPDLKLADLTPIYKKKSKNFKDNYIPKSILSNISKVYERCRYDQIQVFFDSILSKYQCGFRRGYNVQHIKELRNRRKVLIMVGLLVRYSLIFLKHLIVYLTNF